MKIFNRDSYRALFTSQSANVFSTHRSFFRIWTIAEGSFSQPDEVKRTRPEDLTITFASIHRPIARSIQYRSSAFMPTQDFDEYLEESRKSSEFLPRESRVRSMDALIQDWYLYVLNINEIQTNQLSFNFHIL